MTPSDLPFELIRDLKGRMFANGKTRKQSYAEYRRELRGLLNAFIADVLHEPHRTGDGETIPHAVEPGNAFRLAVMMHLLPSSEEEAEDFKEYRKKWREKSFWSDFVERFVAEKARRIYLGCMDPLGTVNGSEITQILPEEVVMEHTAEIQREKERANEKREEEEMRYDSNGNAASTVTDRFGSLFYPQHFTIRTLNSLLKPGGAFPTEGVALTPLTEEERRLVVEASPDGLEAALLAFTLSPNRHKFVVLTCIAKKVLEASPDLQIDIRDKIRDHLIHMAHRKTASPLFPRDFDILRLLWLVSREVVIPVMTTNRQFRVKVYKAVFATGGLDDDAEAQLGHLSRVFYPPLADPEALAKHRLRLAFALVMSGDEADKYIGDGMLWSLDTGTRETAFEFLLSSCYPALWTKFAPFFRLHECTVLTGNGPLKRRMKNRTEQEAAQDRVVAEEFRLRIRHAVERGGALVAGEDKEAVTLEAVLETMSAVHRLLASFTKHRWRQYAFGPERISIASSPRYVMILILCHPGASAIAGMKRKPSGVTSPEMALRIVLKPLAVDAALELDPAPHPTFKGWSWTAEALREFVAEGGLLYHPDASRMRRDATKLLEAPIEGWGRIFLHSLRYHHKPVSIETPWPLVSPAIRAATEEGGWLHPGSVKSVAEETGVASSFQRSPVTRRIVFCDPQSRNVLCFEISRDGTVVKVKLIEGFRHCRPEDSSIVCDRSTDIAAIHPPSPSSSSSSIGRMEVSLQHAVSGKGDSFEVLLRQAPESLFDVFGREGLPLMQTLNAAGDSTAILPLPPMPQDEEALFHLLRELKIRTASYLRRAAAIGIAAASEDKDKRTNRVQSMHSIVSAFLMTMEAKLPPEFVGLIVKVFCRGLLARNDEKAIGRLLPRFERPEIDEVKQEAFRESMCLWFEGAFDECERIGFRGQSGGLSHLQLPREGHVAIIVGDAEDDEEERVYDLCVHDPANPHAEEGVQIIEAAQTFLLSHRDTSGGDPGAFIQRLHDITSQSPDEGVCARLHRALDMCYYLEAPLPVVQLLMATVVLVLVDGDTFKGLLEDPSRVSVLFSGRDLHSHRGMADPNFISAMLASHLTLNESGIVVACIACGKPLRDQDSARLGIGRDCMRKHYPGMLEERKRLQEERKNKNNNKRKRLVVVGGEEECRRIHWASLAEQGGSDDYSLQQCCQYALREDPGNAEMWYTLGAKAGGGRVDGFGRCSAADCYRYVVMCDLEDAHRCFHAEAWIKLATDEGGDGRDAVGCLEEALAVSKGHLPALEQRAANLLAELTEGGRPKEVPQGDAKRRKEDAHGD